MFNPALAFLFQIVRSSNLRTARWPRALVAAAFTLCAHSGLNAASSDQQSAANNAPTSASTTLYSNDFEKLQEGPLPDELMVLNGDFAVKIVEGNHVAQLPGA